MAEVSDEILDLLISHPWDDTVPRLVWHATRKMRLLYWQGLWGGPAPGGVEAADIVQRTIQKVFSGDRRWDPDWHESLFDYLVGVIDSEVSHLVESWENKYLFKEAVLPEYPDVQWETFSYWDCLCFPGPSPETILMEKERQRLSEKFYKEFYDFLEESPPLQTLVECIAEGLEKRSDIAARMDIDVREFDNYKKQLRRRLRSFQEQEAGRPI